MKKMIMVLIIVLGIGLTSEAQTVIKRDTVSMSSEINNIKLNIGKFQKQHYAGDAMQIAGVLIGVGGTVAMYNYGGFDQNALYGVTAVSGGFLFIGYILKLTSYNHLNKIGLGVNGKGVGVSYKF